MIYSLTIRNMVRKYQFDAQNLDEKNAQKLDHQTAMKLIVKQHDLIFILIWLVREEKLSRQNKVETKRFRSMKENCELWEAVWVIRQGWGLTPGWPASWAAWQAGGGGGGGGGGGVQQVRCSPFTRSLVVASGARVWWRWKRLYRRPHNRAATLTGSKGSGHKDTCSAWHHHPPPSDTIVPRNCFSLHFSKFLDLKTPIIDKVLACLEFFRWRWPTAQSLTWNLLSLSPTLVNMCPSRFEMCAVAHRAGNNEVVVGNYQLFLRSPLAPILCAFNINQIFFENPAKAGFVMHIHMRHTNYCYVNCFDRVLLLTSDT